MGGGALADRALGAAVYQDRKVRVGVDINESRRDKASTDVNSLPSPKRASGSNLGDSTTLDSHVAPKPGISTSIQNFAISEHNIQYPISNLES
jgi:hypothetical protein